MGRKQKKRTDASSVQGLFVTRNQALRKLQLTLAQFRYASDHTCATAAWCSRTRVACSKLCILKGIYPREPTHKRRGHDKTYYLAKDIAFLAHDPIIESLRMHKSWAKRVTKATHKKELNRVKVLMTNKPRYQLEHVIRERYVTSELECSAQAHDPDRKRYIPFSLSLRVRQISHVPGRAARHGRRPVDAGLVLGAAVGSRELSHGGVQSSIVARVPRLGAARALAAQGLRVDQGHLLPSRHLGLLGHVGHSAQVRANRTSSCHGRSCS